MLNINTLIKKIPGLGRKIWHDPVGASVIATGVAALLACLPAYFIVGWPRIKELLTSETKISNWCLSLLAVISIIALINFSLKIFSRKENPLTNLLNNALNDEYSITSLLRDARNIAQRRRDNAFVKWVDQELKGEYPSLAPEDLPPYRRVYGDLKALNPYHGWQPVNFATTEMREILTYAPTGQDIGSIEKILKTTHGKPLGFTHSPSQKQTLMDAIPGCTDVELKINRSSLEGILNAARRKVYEWASTFEK